MKQLVPEFISNNSEFEKLDSPKVVTMNKVRLVDYDFRLWVNVEFFIFTFNLVNSI
jgi:hypothetical protein